MSHRVVPWEEMLKSRMTRKRQKVAVTRHDTTQHRRQDHGYNGREEKAKSLLIEITAAAAGHVNWLLMYEQGGRQLEGEGLKGLSFTLSFIEWAARPWILIGALVLSLATRQQTEDSSSSSSWPLIRDDWLMPSVWSTIILVEAAQTICHLLASRERKQRSTIQCQNENT